ncbi:nuclear transport factor 2 family protein [Glycomyces dulcitolivorans]|uniref:nuclear transport factor 2 family protein n=1 Tax=Glycomyces dulcitolivorans TaxID=2200759 RepID=UPI0018E58EF2|nr:nuclear transport factor 2 family protein [Glycomyces dulcitolivorans]
MPNGTAGRPQAPLSHRAGPARGWWSAPKRRRLLLGAGGLVLGGGAASALWAHNATSASAEPEAPSEGVEPAVAVAAVAEIKQVKARYFRAVDTKDWELLKAQLTDDVVVDTTGSGGPVLVGSDAFIAFLQLTLSPAVTVHHGHSPEIEVTSPTTATGVWAMQDLLIFPGDPRVLGFGHYHETYESEDGRWRIAELKLTRVHMDPIGQQQLFGM